MPFFTPKAVKLAKQNTLWPNPYPETHIKSYNETKNWVNRDSFSLSRNKPSSQGVERQKICHGLITPFTSVGFYCFMYRSIPKPPMPPPPRQTPGHLTFLKNFGQIPRYVASLDGQMPHPLELQVGSSPPPSRHVKANCGNKFCKIFSHYQFLVQLVFAPHFKQRHIPRYNYIIQQQQKNPRGIDKNNDPWTRLTCWKRELQNPFASDP